MLPSPTAYILTSFGFSLSLRDGFSFWSLGAWTGYFWNFPFFVHFQCMLGVGVEVWKKAKKSFYSSSLGPNSWPEPPVVWKGNSILVENLRWGRAELHPIAVSACYMQKVDAAIHCFYQTKPVCSHRKLSTNIRRRAIDYFVSPWRFTSMWCLQSTKMVKGVLIENLFTMCFFDNVKSMKFFPVCGHGYSNWWENVPTASASANSGWMQEGLWIRIQQWVSSLLRNVKEP